MNEEEKKAMFQLKDLENDKEHLIIEQRQAITTILNLISKQQNEIKELNKKIQRIYNTQRMVDISDISKNNISFN